MERDRRKSLSGEIHFPAVSDGVEQLGPARLLGGVAGHAQLEEARGGEG